MPRSIKKQYPEIFIDWHPVLNEKLNPSLLKKSSTRKVWWKCHKKRCGFVWQDTVNGRIKKQRGCPRCEERLLNRKVADKFEINTKIQKIEKIFKEIEPLINVFVDEEKSQNQRTKVSIEIRKKLTQFEKLNFALRHSITQQKNFELNKKI